MFTCKAHAYRRLYAELLQLPYMHRVRNFSGWVWTGGVQREQLHERFGVAVPWSTSHWFREFRVGRWREMGIATPATDGATQYGFRVSIKHPLANAERFQEERQDQYWQGAKAPFARNIRRTGFLAGNQVAAADTAIINTAKVQAKDGETNKATELDEIDVEIINSSSRAYTDIDSPIPVATFQSASGQRSPYFKPAIWFSEKGPKIANMVDEELDAGSDHPAPEGFKSKVSGEWAESRDTEFEVKIEEEDIESHVHAYSADKSYSTPTSPH